MDATHMIECLRRQAVVPETLLADVDEARARWRPEPGRWSLLEVACHLRDEERDDFRARLRSTLEDPALPWPPIDPVGWVEARRYAEEDLPRVLDEWRAERTASLAWLDRLERPDWELAHHHPAGFTLKAGDLLAAWVAHDLLHIRQLPRPPPEAPDCPQRACGSKFVPIT